ncbi:MAG: ribonuclease activity regulator RraA [Chloroflexota bacterium]
MAKTPQTPTIATSDIQRPDRALIEALQNVGSATASGELKRLGIRSAFIQGPVCMTPGASVVGPALTLQFMPKREDLYPDAEYVEPETQLHRHVLYHAQPGDIVVVDARADLTSGVFGAMMMTYFRGRGGLGIVIDGAVRDFAEIKELGLGLWLRGVTPNFHTQTSIFPYAVNVPVACGGVTVVPGDIIIADDDGAVVVPIQLAPQLAEKATQHVEWEEFSRMKLAEGGDLRRYYPLSDAARDEYEAWRQTSPSRPS